MPSEYRRDKATDRWRIIAPDRFSRPSDLVTPSQLATDAPKKPCVFCAGNENLTPKAILQYAKNGSWTLRVVPNKYPAVSLEGIRENKQLTPQKDGIFRFLPGFGAHEVIIDTPRHNEAFVDFSADQANDLFWAFRERILDLRKDKRFLYILIFRNDGEAAGASLEHSHCQLIGMPIIPPLIEDEFEEAEEYYNDEGSCVYCSMVSQELAVEKRIIFENEDVVAFVPCAARSPFESWVIPRAHMPLYEESPPSYIRNVAIGVNDVARRLAKVLSRPAYNFFLHNGPLRNAEGSHFHHHFEIVPRITKLGGFEWGTGLYINVVGPEQAAELLKNCEL